MYNPTPPLAGAVGGTLAYTGFNSVWLAVGVFTLMTAGGAILRMLPKRGLTDGK